MAHRERICLQCRRSRRLGFDPWVWKIPWRRAWQPPPVSLPGESHDGGAWRHRVAQSRTRLKRLSSTQWKLVNQSLTCWGMIRPNYLQKGNNQPHPILALLSHLNYEEKNKLRNSCEVYSSQHRLTRRLRPNYRASSAPPPPGPHSHTTKGYLEQLLLPNASCLSIKKKITCYTPKQKTRESKQ